MPDLKSGAGRANDIDFHYLEMGEGPLVLCMHGFPDHAYSFRHLLPDLARAGFRGVAPFMRGYAPTEAPKDGRYLAVLLCRDVLALIGALGAEQAYLVGNDWGAGAVSGAAVLDPAKVAKLVTIASGRADEILSMNFQFLKGTWHAFYFQLPQAERTLAYDDFAFIEDWWRDASPEWEIPKRPSRALKRRSASLEWLRRPWVTTGPDTTRHHKTRRYEMPKSGSAPAQSPSQPWRCMVPGTAQKGLMPLKVKPWTNILPAAWRR